MSRMLKENLATALVIAIEHQAKLEKKQGFFMDSELLAGWRDSLRSIENGEELKIE